MTLPLPEGLEPPKGLVVAVHDQPVLLRTFLPDVGTRALAVGYPGGISVAFDAASCRLAYAWSGNFLDASPVWDGRGGNPAKVLGPRFWNAPPGCPWAVTASLAPPDFAARANDPAHGARLPEGRIYQGKPQLHFDGYTVERTGQPVFHYRLASEEAQDLQVSERIVPLPHAIALGFERRFVLTIPSQHTAWLHAAGGQRSPRMVDSLGSPVALELKASGTELPAANRFVVLPQDDDRAQVLACSSGQRDAVWLLQRLGDTWRILLCLPAKPSAANIELSLKTWLLPRDGQEWIRQCVAPN
jgi:hypothetical protein